jgi:sialate O-acetylesterase
MHSPSPSLIVCLVLAALSSVAQARPLKLHAIFADHAVIQRDKLIMVWGWADPGDEVTVTFDGESATATAKPGSGDDHGRWAVTFPARQASAEPIKLTASTGDEAIESNDILIGDVWIAHGQSNMGWGLASTSHRDMAIPQANMPLLRHFGIKSNTHETLQSDIPAESIHNGGWEVSTSGTARDFSAIAYHFGSNVQRALQIPIGIITNSRGGASIESMVPEYKFAEHPLTAAYKAHEDARIAAFDHRAEALKKWEQALERAKREDVPKDKWPAKPKAYENLSTWGIPGVSPADAASVYNGMFGVLKGLHFKGVLFHQGYNNALGKNCRPKRYRALMTLMVEGWREEFENPTLPVAVIGLCAGGERQHEDNFELMSTDSGPYIREAQRLGLADAGDDKYLAFLPAYDVQIPGLHPGKKREHGERAARWALSQVYEFRLPDHRVNWRTAKLVKAETKGDVMILTFDNEVFPDDYGSIPRGFSLAGEDGKFYRAHARFQAKAKQRQWHNATRYNSKVVYVWSPLVQKPVAVRYGWARNPEGNLKVNGNPDVPLQSFRTDQWDWPEHEDPTAGTISRSESKAMQQDAIERLNERQRVEAERGIEVLERTQGLGRLHDDS